MCLTAIINARIVLLVRFVIFVYIYTADILGIESFGDVLDYVQADSLKQRLSSCKKEHEVLMHEVQKMLDEYHDDGKDPNPMALWFL